MKAAHHAARAGECAFKWFSNTPEERYARAVEEPEMGCIRLRTLSVRACCFLASLHKGRYTGSERVGMRDVYAYTLR